VRPLPRTNSVGAFRPFRDAQAHRTDSLHAPAVGQPDHEQARVARSVERTLAAHGNQHRLGDDPDDLLNEQRRAREQAARVPPAERGIGFGAEQAERRSQCTCEARRDLDRRPIVFDAAERPHDRA
jgi:hypothetical protein